MRSSPATCKPQFVSALHAWPMRDDVMEGITVICNLPAAESYTNTDEQYMQQDAGSKREDG